MSMDAPIDIGAAVNAAVNQVFEQESSVAQGAENDMLPESRVDVDEGKAAPKEKAAESPVETEEKSESAEVPEQEDTEEPTVDDVKLIPNPRWSKEVKEVFDKQPLEVQEFMLAREADIQKFISKKGQELADKIKEVEKDREQYTIFDKVISTGRQHWQKAGIPPEQALAALINLDIEATKDPAGVIRTIAQRAGIDLAQLAQQPAQQMAKAGNYDPELAQLKQQVEQLSRTNELALGEHFQKAINEFASAKNTDGELLYPHFEDLRAEMSNLMKVGVAETMEEAYQIAALKNKDVREKIEEARIEAENKLRIERSKKALEAARKGATPTVKKTQSTHKSAPVSWEETVKSLARSL